MVSLRHAIQLSICFLCFASPLCHAAPSSENPTPSLHVMASIKPLHSLVAGVMQGVDTPELLVSGQQSPHDFQFKPSQIGQLHHAKLVFYMDDTYETFLARGLQSAPDSVRPIALSTSKDIALLPLRKGGVWEAHDEHHEEHQDEHHDEHTDMHVWLNPQNAIAMTRTIADTLSETYPKYTSVFMRNATAQIAAISALDKEITNKLKNLEDKPFIVFHDAYQYFERHYRINGVGSITFEPSESPTPSRIQDIREKIITSGATCVFREPYVSQKLINIVTEDRPVHFATLDPEGTSLPPSPSLYFTLMRQIADNVYHCLRVK